MPRIRTTHDDSRNFRRFSVIGKINSSKYKRICRYCKKKYADMGNVCEECKKLPYINNLRH